MNQPIWMTDKGKTILEKGYTNNDETIDDMYQRVARSAGKYADGTLGHSKKYWEDKFYEYIAVKNWICPASPVLSNLGNNRGLPISCYSIDVDDSVSSIMDKAKELAMLSKNGGGVGVGFNRVRPAGMPIQSGKNGVTDGIMSFLPIFDKVINGISQGSVRRGAASINLDIAHGDFDEFIRMRRPEGDVNRRCANLHHCTQIDDEFMNKLISGDSKSKELWAKLMLARFETGEPYTMFTDNVNKANPTGYKKLGLDVSVTNICSEILLHTSPLYSFICCLLSMNLVKFEEWENTDAMEVAVVFLNAVLDEFIEKSENIDGLECARNSAIKGRAIGIGVLGWHTLLQNKMLPFDDMQSMMLNYRIFSNMKDNAVKASKKLAEQYGEPEWCLDQGTRNSHLLAVAPTRSNSIISGGVSAGIEPIIMNAFTDKTAKGNFIEKNKNLEELLESKSKNTSDVWDDISINSGSCQHLDFLSDDEKKVFKTAYEINPMALIRQAGQRQKHICQSQSLNLFFPLNTNPKFFSDCHIEAWKAGVKTLYYVRTQSKLKSGTAISHTIDGCESCES